VEIDLAEPCALWRPLLPDIDRLCAEAALAAIAGAEAPLPGAAELSIVLGDDALVRSLNRQWRGRDAPTNVLAFAAQEGETPDPASPLPLLLGDVVLACETVTREATSQGKPLADHLRHLVVHGVLHLLGYDHIDDDDAARMEALETLILARLHVPDPYRERDTVETADG
jgi:probable rRNA maturation factor